MNSMRFAKILLAIAIILIVSLPIFAVLQIDADADVTDSVITSVNNDYVFFVVEDGQTPLAAAPKASNTHSSLFGFVLMASSMVILFIYSMWCLTIKHNVNVMIEKLPYFLRSSLRNTNVFLHPLKSKQAIKDAEYNITFKYVNYN